MVNQPVNIILNYNIVIDWRNWKSVIVLQLGGVKFNVNCTFKSLAVSATENFKYLIVICIRVTSILWELTAPRLPTFCGSLLPLGYQHFVGAYCLWVTNILWELTASGLPTFCGSLLPPGYQHFVGAYCLWVTNILWELTASGLPTFCGSLVPPP
jgi:hypothetical protein